MLLLQVLASNLYVCSAYGLKLLSINVFKSVTSSFWSGFQQDSLHKLDMYVKG